MRTFRLSAWVSSVQHKRRCSHARWDYVSFRDVKIKFPDRNWDPVIGDVTHRKHGLRFEEKQLVEFERGSRDLELGEARRRCALRAPWFAWVESWRCKSSLHRKIVRLSPHVEKPLNSKVIKSFVPELRGQKIFCVSGFLCYPYMSYEHSMYTSIFLYSYVTYEVECNSNVVYALRTILKKRLGNQVERGSAKTIQNTALLYLTGIIMDLEDLKSFEITQRKQTWKHTWKLKLKPR